MGGLFIPRQLRCRKGLAVGKWGHVDGTCFVGKDDRFWLGTCRPCDKEVFRRKQGPAKIKPVRVIMIACNDDGRDLFPQDELDEDFIKGAYGFRGRDGAVIDIACNEEGIDLFLPDDAHKLAKDRHLVLKEMKAMKDAPQMPVRCVEKTHDTHPFCTWKKEKGCEKMSQSSLRSPFFVCCGFMVSSIKRNGSRLSGSLF